MKQEFLNSHLLMLYETEERVLSGHANFDRTAKPRPNPLTPVYSGCQNPNCKL